MVITNRFFITCAFLFFSLQLAAQDKSNKGKEFWLGYGYNYNFDHYPPYNGQTLAIYISAEEAATVTVSVNNTGWSQTVTIPANSVDFSIQIPKSGTGDARLRSEGKSDKGIHIVSDVPVVVFAHQYISQLSGATMLMPVETYGYTYYSVNYTQTSYNFQGGYSWFFVVASEDNTQLEITPSDATQGGWIKGQTYTVNLNKGEIYNVFGKADFNSPATVDASKDMTGSKIVSVAGADGKCHPVAVFSGSGCIRICPGDGGEYMHQQMFPANAWGTRYLTYHTLNNINTNVTQPNLNFYRIAVQDPTTVVKKNGVVMTGLVNNFYYEYSGTLGDYIEADKPILVAQYMVNENQCVGNNNNGNGDSEMFYLSPIEQGVKKTLFYNPRKDGINLCYVNILLPTAGVASLKVDGGTLPAANIITHPTYPGYSVAVARFTGLGAQHSVTSDSTFTATIYGLGIFESYGFNAGCLVNNLNAYSSIKNTYNTNGKTDTFTCPKTQVSFSIKVAYPLTNIHWKLSEAGGGLFPNTDSIIANPVPVATSLVNSRMYYTYALQQDFTFATPGTYFIPVTYTAPTVDNCDHTETANIKVVVTPGPSTDFSVSKQNCINDDIQFTGTPSSANFNIVSHLWSFEDLTTAGTINTVKKFTTPGNQNVRYRIFADNGCTGDTTKVVNILESPVAKFGITNACSGEAVMFTDTSAITTGTIMSWHWIFGDGATVTNTTNATVNHTYTNGGSYTASLVVTSDKGCNSDTLKRTFTILPKPFAKFGFDKNICVGDSVKLSDSSYVGQSLTSWRWIFGDGTTADKTNENPFYHTYTAANNYTVSLIVTSSACQSDTFKLKVLVTGKPSSSFTIAGKPCIDSTQKFISSISTTPATWYWDFGDGNTLNTTSSNIATHTYTTALSNVVVKHVVKTGCTSDTVSVVIPFVRPNPVAAFTILGDTLCERAPLMFTAPPTPGIATWSWNFGNGAGNNVPPFTRTYNTANNYTVSLKVTDNNGCGSLAAQQAIKIGTAPDIDAGPDMYVKAGAGKTIQATVTNPLQHQFLWSPPDFLNNTTILTPVATPEKNMVYIIKAINTTTNCIAYDSVVVKIVTEVFIPSAFTPNGDGRNDVWQIPALEFYPNAMVSVYNRYGQTIYQSKGYKKPWDGTYKGLPQPTGAYIYIIQPTDNPIQNIKGTVMIIR